MSIISTSKKYDAPPIVEVVCGFHFDPIAGLDPVMIGRFWTDISDEFPKREFRPAVQAPGVSTHEFVVAALPPLRALLIADDGASLLQLQQDRFYFNWRRESFEAAYPRFSDHNGKPGVGSTALKEFGRFGKFCEGAFSSPPRVMSVELAKVDLLVEGRHWSNFKDLSELLPWLNSYQTFSKTDSPTFALRFEEQRTAGLLSVGMSIAPGVGPHSGKRVVKIEGRLTTTTPGGADLPIAFTRLNSELNEVFEDLIPEEERSRRFMKGEPGA